MREARRGRRDKAGTRIAQLPWERVRNPHGPMDLLTPDQMQDLRDTSIRILKDLGVKVMGANARALFARAGARIDDDGIVRIDESLVEAALASAPRQFTLTPRNPDRRVHLGSDDLVFGQVAGPPNVHDRLRGRRSGNLADYQDFIRLAQHFNAIHLIGNQVTAPLELPANNRHLDTCFANLTLSDLSFHCTAIGRGRAMDGIRMMAIARGVTLEEIARDPGVITIISVNSPRLLDDAMGDGLIAMAQQNAEAPFGVVLTQLVRPGAPVMYGAFTSNMDMRSGAPAFGTPENAKANVVAGQLARCHGLPYRTSNANASNAVDLQAAYETAMATWGAVMGGANLIYHAAGWLEDGLTASFGKLILDVEIPQNMIEFLRPVKWDAAELGFEAIRDVAPGRHFFGAAHTMERYEHAFYQPMLSDWQSYENWALAGAKEAGERATDLGQQALREYEEPPVDPAIREELEAYVARRDEKIGDDEP